MSKWNRWKLVHKETGLTFNQHHQKHGTRDVDGIHRTKGMYNSKDMIPVLLESGIPAVYVQEQYYPFMFFLNNKEWEVRMK